MKKITSPLLNYENKWVALSPDHNKVMASGKSIKEIDKKLKSMNNEDAILTFVLPFDKSYAP